MCRSDAEVLMPDVELAETDISNTKIAQDDNSTKKKTSKAEKNRKTRNKTEITEEKKEPKDRRKAATVERRQNQK